MLTRSARLLLLLLSLPAGAVAQTAVRAPGGTLRGQVRDSATGEPVAYALVVLASRDQRVFTSASGRFVLTGLVAGRARIRVQQVGYGAREMPLLVDTRPLPGGGASDLVVHLVSQAVLLPELSISAKTCLGMGEVGATAAEGGSILDETFKTAERILALERKYPFILEYERYVTRLDSNYHLLDGKVDTIPKDSRKYGPYRAGRLLDRGIGRERLAAFTSSDIASAEFQRTHCFRYAGRDTLDRFVAYRIEFEPRPGLTTMDWAGSILVDSASMTFLRTDTRLVNIPARGTGFLSATCSIFYQPIFPGLPQEFQLRCISSWKDPRHIRVERQVLINRQFIGKPPVDPGLPQ